MFGGCGKRNGCKRDGVLEMKGATVDAGPSGGFREKLSPRKNQNEIFMFPAKVSIWLDFKGRLTEKQETKGKNQVGCG